MATITIALTKTPADIIDGESLANGDYILQNVGNGLIFVNNQDIVLADPSTALRRPRAGPIPVHRCYGRGRCRCLCVERSQCRRYCLERGVAAWVYSYPADKAAEVAQRLG